jgi:hypothetical protein
LSTSPAFFALIKNLVIVCTLNLALLAKALTSIQTPKGISSIALSALLTFVGIVIASFPVDRRIWTVKSLLKRLPEGHSKYFLKKAVIKVRALLVSTKFNLVLQSLKRREVCDFILIWKFALFQIGQNVAVVESLDSVAANPWVPLTVWGPNLSLQQQRALVKP